MIKICYIITKFELGGAQKIVLSVAENIDKSIFDRFIIAGQGGILEDKATEKFKLYRLKNLVREISPIKDLKTLFSMYCILKREKPDIVHTHSSKAGVLGRIAAKLAGVKNITHTIHGYGFNKMQKWYVKYLFILLEKICALLSNKLIVVTKEDIKKGLHYKIAKENKYMLIRAGIDTNFYKNFVPNPRFKESLKLDKNTKVVTTIGAFKPQKNHKDFIKAASIVSKVVKNVVFLLIGDGQEHKNIENLIGELDLEDKFMMLGWRTDIAEILKISDIFVLTSLWEGLPCAILEAMCCSKAVIANDVDGVKEVVVEKENGFLIEPGNYNKTAEKIIYLLSNDICLKEMGKKAFDSIGFEYDINYVIKQHEEFYWQMYGKV